MCVLPRHDEPLTVSISNTRSRSQACSNAHRTCWIDLCFLNAGCNWKQSVGLGSYSTSAFTLLLIISCLSVSRVQVRHTSVFSIQTSIHSFDLISLLKATEESWWQSSTGRVRLSPACMEPRVASPAQSRQVWQRTPAILALRGEGRSIGSPGSSLVTQAVLPQENLLNECKQASQSPRNHSVLIL